MTYQLARSIHRMITVGCHWCQKNFLILLTDGWGWGNASRPLLVVTHARVPFHNTGIIGIHPKTARILQLLRLRQIHNVVFVKLNKATLTMLNWVEPYIAYGYPSRKTVETLVYKRGFAKVNKQRIPITNNLIIDQNLGEFGIRCVEDLIHEIVTIGPHFKQANNFLWPFKLSSPVGGFSSKTKLLHFMEGGEAGARGEEINKLVKRML